MLLRLIKGTVIRGTGLGKKFGLPKTLNLRISSKPKSLRYGIYAVQVKTPAGVFRGVMHYGPRPAVKAPKSCEVHAFGLKRNLYGKRVEISVKKYLRAIKNFPNIQALKKAILKDINMARRVGDFGL